MNSMQLLDNLKSEFNQTISLREKRPGLYQLVAPLFHKDGDMLDVFLSQTGPASNPSMEISDCGLTQMRLSQSIDLDSPATRKAFDSILAGTGIRESEGRLVMEAKPGNVYPAILQFADIVARICNMPFQTANQPGSPSSPLETKLLPRSPLT